MLECLCTCISVCRLCRSCWIPAAILPIIAPSSILFCSGKWTLQFSVRGRLVFRRFHKGVQIAFNCGQSRDARSSRRDEPRVISRKRRDSIADRYNDTRSGWTIRVRPRKCTSCSMPRENGKMSLNYAEKKIDEFGKLLTASRKID